MPFDPTEDWETRKDRVVGLGERSFRKSYYPQLQQNIDRLELFRTLLDRTSDFVILVTLDDGTIVDANAALGRLLGEPVETLIGRPFASLGIADATVVFGALREEMNNRSDGGETPTHPLVVEFSAQGVSIWLELSYQIALVDKRAYGVLVGRDITKRKAAEADRYLFSEAMRQSSQPMLLADSRICVTYINPAFSRLFGYQLNELVGEPVRRLVPKTATEDCGHTEVIRQVETHGAWSGEVVRQARDGTLIPVLLSVATIRGEREDLIGYEVSYIDVRKLRESEASLRKLSQAVEQSSESIVVTNLDARIEYVNEAFVQNTGYTREESIGQNPNILKSNKTSPETYASLWNALKQGQNWRGEFHNRRKDGSEFTELAIISPIRQADGRISHYVAVKEDITERKQNAEELERHRHHLEELVDTRTRELAAARDAADAANRAKSTFVANMSHEIRTPMNGILGMAHLMRRGGVSPTQAEQLDKIFASAKHLLGILNNILDLSKIEADKLVLEQQDFVLDDMLSSASAVIGDAAKAKGLKLLIDVSGIPQALHGDPTRLSQALVNYLGNAIKFTEHGRVTLKGLVIEETSSDYLLRFEVSDTGIGIPVKHKAQIFKSFEQVDNSISRKYGGTGLGLAITKRIIQLMGGEVGVESIPGHGSTFWLTVRLSRGHEILAATADHPDEPAESILRRDYSGKRILLAEDDPVNQEVALLLLRNVGLMVDLAKDGIQALRMAGGGEYDIILMDMQMPELDGLEAAYAIRRIAGREMVPIVAMTANVFAEDRAKCLAAGMDDFVAKPVDPAALFATLLKWLSKHSNLSESAPDAPARTPTPTVTTTAYAFESNDTTQWRQQLEQIPGLDVERGLSLTRGSTEEYLRLLTLFANSHEQDLPCLSEKLISRDLVSLQKRAHTLKGSAGNVGAIWVSEAANLLYDTIDQRADLAEIDDCRIALIAELSRLIGRIQSILTER